jgi:predicted kinase
MTLIDTKVNNQLELGMKRIPLHSLVIMVGPSGGGKTHHSRAFPSYEVISDADIRFSLVGDRGRYDIADIVSNEVKQRVETKLMLGERAVVDGSYLKVKDRQVFLDLAKQYAVPIFYIVCNQNLEGKLADSSRAYRFVTKQEALFRSQEKEIQRGDGFANVIDTRREQFRVVGKFTNYNLKTQIEKADFRGLMVIGDVHGMIESLKNATEWATQRNLFCIFLGDIVDYGPHSRECVEHVYDVVTRGRGISIIGNHERKIYRWLDQVKTGKIKVHLSDGNKVTTHAVEAMGSAERFQFEVKFKALYNLSKHHWLVNNTLFAHAAAEPEMFQIFHQHHLTGELEVRALFGEVDSQTPSRNDGYPNRIYSWVDRIPKGKRVMVGHDIRSTTKPPCVKGKRGGEAYFMDTGSGKGGRLTSADILFQGEELSLQNFKYH